MVIIHKFDLVLWKNVVLLVQITDLFTNNRGEETKGYNGKLWICINCLLFVCGMVIRLVLSLTTLKESFGNQKLNTYCRPCGWYSQDYLKCIKFGNFVTVQCESKENILQKIFTN